METIEQFIQKLVSDKKTDPRDFFLAWNISPAIIAERLRIAGFPADAKDIKKILDKGIKKNEDLYRLSIVMMEMRNDITKTLYGK